MDNNKKISVICQCLNVLHVSGYRSLFDDHRSRKLFTGSAIELHVIAQLLQLPSYDVISEQLQAQPALRKAVGLDSISGAQLSRKTKTLCTQSLQQLFYDLVAQIHTRTKLGKGVSKSIGRLHLVDATDISMPHYLGRWARCGSRKTAVRLHVRLIVADPYTTFPDRIIGTTANVQESNLTLELTVDRKATYVMDRGYEKRTDFEQLVADEIRFVTRVRDCLQLFPVIGPVRELPASDSVRILQDADVTMRKSTTFLRLVEFEDLKGRRYRVVTNRWDLTALEIAMVYKNRWLIELFFKWVKQHLKMVKLCSFEQEAVWNHVFLSLIAYAVSLLVKLRLQTPKSQWEVLKLLRSYFYHSWQEFLAALNRVPSRKSRGRQKTDRVKLVEENQRVILR